MRAVRFYLENKELLGRDVKFGDDYIKPWQ